MFEARQRDLIVYSSYLVEQYSSLAPYKSFALLGCSHSIAYHFLSHWISVTKVLRFHLFLTPVLPIKFDILANINTNPKLFVR